MSELNLLEFLTYRDDHPVKKAMQERANAWSVDYTRFVDNSGSFDPARLAEWKGENVRVLANRVLSSTVRVEVSENKDTQPREEAV